MNWILKTSVFFAFVLLIPMTADSAPPWAQPQEPIEVVVTQEPLDIVVTQEPLEILVTVDEGQPGDTLIIRQGSYKMVSGSLGLAAAGLQFGRGIQDMQAGCYAGNDSFTTSLVCGAGTRLNNGWFVNGSYGHDFDLDIEGWNLGFMLSIK